MDFDSWIYLKEIFANLLGFSKLFDTVMLRLSQLVHTAKSIML